MNRSVDRKDALQEAARPAVQLRLAGVVLLAAASGALLSDMSFHTFSCWAATLLVGGFAAVLAPALPVIRRRGTLLQWAAGTTLSVAAAAPVAWSLDLIGGDRSPNALLRTLGGLALLGLLVQLAGRQRDQLTQTQRQVLSSRLQTLVLQIRPHFLFNALNSLSALIATRSEDAERLVGDLAEIFRATLERPGATVSFQQELELCEAYLRIEQARLGNRLAVRWALASATLNCRLPPLTLQPLIENAVYHGISQRRAGGVLSVQATVENQRLELRVSNPLPQDVSSYDWMAHCGIALRNVQERLSLLYGTEGSLEHGREGDCYFARIRLPATTACTQQVAA
jgi:two-component system sensor histidine kinase AlgZ